MTEVRKVSPTGGEKGSKLARFDLIPAGPLKALAEMYGKGAEKYADRNWERGFDWSLSFAAMQRHAWAFWSGEDNDPEHGLPHMASVAFHAFALLEFMATHPGFDNRPTPPGVLKLRAVYTPTEPREWTLLADVPENVVVFDRDGDEWRISGGAVFFRGGGTRWVFDGRADDTEFMTGRDQYAPFTEVIE